MAYTASPPPLEQVSPSDEFMIGSSVSGNRLEASDEHGNSNAGHPRKPVWNRPINGNVEGISIMDGAISWPALSESIRPISRSSSESIRPVSDGSASPSQAPPLISQPPQRQGNSSTNNTNKPRSRNRGGGGPSHSTFSRPSPPAAMPFHVLEAPFCPIPPLVGAGARPGAGITPRTPFRRGHNYGPHHNNYGGRWREANIRPPPYMPPPPPPPIAYMPRPLPPVAPPFMGPPPPLLPPLRCFQGQMGFEMASPFIYMPQQLGPKSYMVPIVSQPMSMVLPPFNEETLENMITKQIEYYFSDDNLAKDSYLRSKMDDQGWVPITLIASFHRVEQLTKDVHIILDALKHSTVVELQGEKVRKYATWQKWLRPSIPGGSRNSVDVKDATH